jgi:hypothetical protein
MQDVQLLLVGVAGIRSLEPNPLTGSLVVWFEARSACAEVVLERLERAGYVDRANATTNDQYIHGAVATTGGIVWSAVWGAVVEALLGRSALSVLSILI